MIYVTHDQVEAMTLADRIVVLNAGRIEQIGTPADIYHAPTNLFVACFLGSPRMNLLPGKVIRVQKTGIVVALASGEQVTVAVDGGDARAGDDVKVGVRPESLHRQAGDNGLTLTVDVVETLGAARSIYGIVPGADPGAAMSVCAVLAADDPARHDEVVTLYFAATDAYAFDATGQAFPRLAAVKKAS